MKTEKKVQNLLRKKKPENKTVSAFKTKNLKIKIVEALV